MSRKHGSLSIRQWVPKSVQSHSIKIESPQRDEDLFREYAAQISVCSQTTVSFYTSWS